MKDGDRFVTACPLYWPRSKPRILASERRHAPFGKGWTVAKTSHNVLHELDLMGVRDWNVVISTNLELRRDGLPRSGQRTPEDPGVAVWFVLEGEPRVLACDWWMTIAHNMHAIVKDIEATRGRTRWGVGSLREAFAGYKAIPASTDVARKSWREILGPCETLDEVRAAFRDVAKVQHPDIGGSNHDMAQITRARDEALAELKG